MVCGGVCMPQHTCGDHKTTCRSHPSSFYVGPKDQTPANRVGSKCLYLLNHPSDFQKSPFVKSEKAPSMLLFSCGGNDSGWNFSTIGPGTLAMLLFQRTLLSVVPTPRSLCRVLKHHFKHSSLPPICRDLLGKVHYGSVQVQTKDPAFTERFPVG